MFQTVATFLVGLPALLANSRKRELKDEAVTSTKDDSVYDVNGVIKHAARIATFQGFSESSGTPGAQGLAEQALLAEQAEAKSLLAEIRKDFEHIKERAQVGKKIKIVLAKVKDAFEAIDQGTATVLELGVVEDTLAAQRNGVSEKNVEEYREAVGRAQLRSKDVSDKLAPLRAQVEKVKEALDPVADADLLPMARILRGNALTTVKEQKDVATSFDEKIKGLVTEAARFRDYFSKAKEVQVAAGEVLTEFSNIQAGTTPVCAAEATGARAVEVESVFESAKAKAVTVIGEIETLRKNFPGPNLKRPKEVINNLRQVREKLQRSQSATQEVVRDVVRAERWWFEMKEYVVQFENIYRDLDIDGKTRVVAAGETVGSSFDNLTGRPSSIIMSVVLYIL